MAYVKPPTGCTITRSGNSFTMSWKCGETYSHQVMRFRTSVMTKSPEQWVQPSIGAGTTSYTYTINPNDFTPTTRKQLERIVFRIRGFKNGWSDKSEVNYYTWRAATPPVPSLTAELSGNHSNVTTFTWDVSLANADTDNYMFKHVQWESILVKESNVTDGSKLTWGSGVLGWQTGTGSRNSSYTITEDTALLANASYTRWFRVRARGMAYDSAWRYAKHVYAAPYQAKIRTANVTKTSTGLRCNVTWEASQNASHPIDSTTVQYVITPPAAGLTCPSGISWEDADTSRDTGGLDAVSFPIYDQLNENECLFVRVNTVHDPYASSTTNGDATLAQIGQLAKPTNLSAQTVESTHRATITATNAAETAVADSFLVVMYRTASAPDAAFPIGIIPHGENSVTVQCPDWSAETGKSFGVYAAVGSYSQITRSDGVTAYEVNARMISETQWDGGSVPNAPTNVTASHTNIPGTVRVTWDWTWTEADSTEISWADHEDAWESTDEPSKYTISNLHAAQWNISGLETGITWYIRVRLAQTTDDKTTYGPWSEMVSIDLSSAPAIPILTLSEGVVTEDGSVTASWVYSTTDGTSQAYAQICEATINSGTITYGRIIAHTETAQHIMINAQDAGWTVGNTYNLCVQVVSASGHASDAWSDPVAVVVAEPLVASITSTSLEEITEDGRTFLGLTEMPLTLTVTGAGTSGQTSVVIERARDFHMLRPDDSEYDGFEGEAIAIYSQYGEGEITITNDDLIGYFDDGAEYRIVATVQDDLGQSAEDVVYFEAHWSHQAVIPEATVVIADNVAKITPAQVTGAVEGDYVDIYRLSADKPELIYTGAELGETYVDPYPTIGEHGGHRVVFRTANRDYITADNVLAWLDLGQANGDYLDSKQTIINFGGDIIALNYNMEVSNDWSKDFQMTKYLGGAIQGDWNNSVERTTSVSAVAISYEDQNTILAMRRLARYNGICHIRTPEGSSYAANIEVSEDYSYDTAGKIANFDLSITRVDPEELDGLTLSDWEDINGLE